jgi:hypothetical protein
MKNALSLKVPFFEVVDPPIVRNYMNRRGKNDSGNNVQLLKLYTQI